MQGSPRKLTPVIHFMNAKSARVCDIEADKSPMSHHLSFRIFRIVEPPHACLFNNYAAEYKREHPFAGSLCRSLLIRSLLPAVQAACESSRHYFTALRARPYARFLRRVDVR